MDKQEYFTGNFVKLGEELLKSQRDSWQIREVIDKNGKTRKVRVNPAKSKHPEESIRKKLKRTKSLEDSDIVSRALSTNERMADKAMSELYLKYKEDAFKIINTFVQDKETAQDLVADSFVKVQKNLQEYNKHAETLPFKHWFTRLCSNTARDYLRSAANAFSQNAASEEEKQVNFNSASDSLTPEQQAINADMAKNIASALNKLPEEYSSAIKEYYFNGKTIKEIAKEYNVSVSGVQARLTRGKAILKSIISPELYKAVSVQFIAIEAIDNIEQL